MALVGVLLVGWLSAALVCFQTSSRFRLLAGIFASSRAAHGGVLLFVLRRRPSAA